MNCIKNLSNKNELRSSKIKGFIKIDTFSNLSLDKQFTFERVFLLVVYEYIILN